MIGKAGKVGKAGKAGNAVESPAVTTALAVTERDGDDRPNGELPGEPPAKRIEPISLGEPRWAAAEAPTEAPNLAEPPAAVEVTKSAVEPNAAEPAEASGPAAARTGRMRPNGGCECAM